MARQTPIYRKIPWTGGLNTAVDSGVLPDNDLVIADNVVFSTAASRLKREGFSYLDTAIPAVTHRSSSGTNRTLVFASSVNIASPEDRILVVGEKIIVSGGPANYNTSEGIISAIATTTTTNDTITYTFSGAASLAEGSTATSAITVTKASNVIACLDMWYWDTSNNVKVQCVIAVTDQPKIFKYDANGRRVELTKHAAATVLTGPITSCDLRVYNEKLLMAFSGASNTPKFWNPNGGTTTWEDLSGSPPNFSIMQEHLGRLFVNDKTDADKLHYCETFDETKWQGIGDSGALFVSTGDGDLTGISAIFPPFQGSLYVGKGTKLRRVLGDAPENFNPVDVSEGIGALSHKAVVAVDMDDVLYVSKRGIHSLAATDKTGDFESSFMSKKIQQSFVSWNQGRVKFMQGAYISSPNSVAFVVSEDGDTAHSALWLFNVEFGEWYRWPDVNAQSVASYLDGSSKVRILFGTNRGRVALAQNGTYTDYGTTAIRYRVKTGTIYVTGDPSAVVAFKRLTFLYRPKGDYSFTAYFTVDNQAPQPLVFEQSADGDTLGETFTLGTSVLGARQVLAPFSRSVDGIGRGFTLEIMQSDTNGQVEIYGFMVEYEPADIAQEVDDGTGETA